MPRYSHAYDFAFEVTSNHEEGEDVTPAMIRAALIERALRIPDSEITEACGLYDTCEAHGAHLTCKPIPIQDGLRITRNGLAYALASDPAA